MKYDNFPFSKNPGNFLVGRNPSSPKITRPSFRRNQETPFFERIVLSIFGILVLIFASYYPAIISSPENLPAFHWIWFPTNASPILYD